MAKDLKPHIGIFGRRNSGKSSLINRLTGQDIAIVSDTAGTTTDPVKKSIEIFGIGPCVLIDTAGIDDVGELGKQRVEKSLKVLEEIDCAILVITGNQFGEPEQQLISRMKELAVPFSSSITKQTRNNFLPLRRPWSSRITVLKLWISASQETMTSLRWSMC